MTKFGFACAILAIVAVATWAYNVNYETKTTLNRIEALRDDISGERERIQVLRVEWAWLNNPERLERLSDAHANALGLQPMSPDTFGEASLVPMPPEGESADGGALIAGAFDADPAATFASLLTAPAGMMSPIPRPISWSGR